MSGWLRDRLDSGYRATVDVPLRADPWRPPLLANVRDAVLHELTYAVLDEHVEVEGEISLVLARWPRVDELGRLRHSDTVEVGVPIDAWKALLAARRIPEALRDRAPRIGDAFAMLVTRRDLKHVLDPVGPVVDITADARDAAKAAFYGAVAEPLDPGAVAETAEDDQVPPVDEPADWVAEVEAVAR